MNTTNQKNFRVTRWNPEPVSQAENEDFDFETRREAEEFFTKVSRNGIAWVSIFQDGKWVDATNRLVWERDMKRVIVSRHPSAVAFIKDAARIDYEIEVLESATAVDVTGAIVYGNLPLHLAALAHCVYALEFEGEAPRGREYTIDDMRASGAVLRRYTVKAG